MGYPMGGLGRERWELVCIVLSMYLQIPSVLAASLELTKFPSPMGIPRTFVPWNLTGAPISPTTTSPVAGSRRSISFFLSQSRFLTGASAFFKRRFAHPLLSDKEPLHDGECPGPGPNKVNLLSKETKGTAGAHIWVAR